jgi:gluconokinase
MKFSDLPSPHTSTVALFTSVVCSKRSASTPGPPPDDYRANLGGGFDDYCCKFLWVDYTSLVSRTKQGGSDAEILEWAFQQGRRPDDVEIKIWNDFMRKRGWRDDASARLAMRKKESGFSAREDIQTLFDYIDLDEGREPGQ